MSRRVAGVAVLAAAATAGMLFGPVFSTRALLVSVLAAIAAVFVVDQLALRWRWLATWRLAVGMLAGLLVIAEILLRRTTTAGIPNIATARTLYDGVVNGWLRTLESTLPARPDPQLLLFVPVLVLAASVLSVEALRRERSPFLVLAPSLLVLGLAQAFRAVHGAVALAAGMGYALAAGAVLASTPARPAAGEYARDSTRPARTRTSLLLPAAATAAALAVGAATFVAIDPMNRPAYSLQHHHIPPAVPSSVVDPLDEIAARLADPDTVAFLDSTQTPIDRWPIAVLDDFDGVNWATSAQFRPLGTDLAPDTTIAAPQHQCVATITIKSAAGPWLVTQKWLRMVEGIDPLVDSVSGTLLSTRPTTGLRYRLRWDAPEVSVDMVKTAALGRRTATSMAVGPMPPGLGDLAVEAVGHRPASWQAALVLEDYFRKNFYIATGGDLPTGHSYPQLMSFLTTTKRGTSEQFAAAYVVLARILGIPARLVVGFRQSTEIDSGGNSVVRNRDVLAWPEVAVSGLGWVALDPTNTVAAAVAPDQHALAGALDQARKDLPQPNKVDQDVTPPPLPPASVAPPARRPWVLWVGLGALGAGAAAVLAIIILKRARWWRRRHGPPVAAVIGAWHEARDRIRDHGVAVRRGMTVRDLGVETRGVLGQATGDALQYLAHCVDLALWSGAPPTDRLADEAWSAEASLRRAITVRPLTVRLKAALSLRSLLPLRH